MKKVGTGIIGVWVLGLALLCSPQVVEAQSPLERAMVKRESTGDCPGFELRIAFDSERRPLDVRVARLETAGTASVPDVLSEEIIGCLIDELTPSQVRGGELPLHGSVVCSGTCVTKREYGNVTITATWPAGLNMEPCPSLHFDWR